jgi:N-methylhydantoinase B
MGDGLDGHSWWPLFKAVPTEYLEKYYPLRVDAYRTRSDSGGAGYHRGGHGVDKVYTFLEDGQISFQDDRAHTFPWGVGGGRFGASSHKRLIRADGTKQDLPSKVENLPVRRGDKLVFATAGAGGLGSPFDREPERVAKDVRAGLVSKEAAAEQYGVILTDEGKPDVAATESQRAKLRERSTTEQFDFGPLPQLETLRSQIAQERRDFDAEMAAREELRG